MHFQQQTTPRRNYTWAFNAWILGRPGIADFCGSGGPSGPNPENRRSPDGPKNHVCKTQVFTCTAPTKPKTQVRTARWLQTVTTVPSDLLFVCRHCRRRAESWAIYPSVRPCFHTVQRGSTILRGIPKRFLGQVFFWRFGAPRPKNNTFSRNDWFLGSAAEGVKAHKATCSWKMCGFLASVPQASEKNTWPSKNHFAKETASIYHYRRATEPWDDFPGFVPAGW